MYGQLQRLLLGDYDQRNWVVAYERYLSNTFFMGQKITLIPRLPSESEDDREILHIKVGTEKERPIHLIGDGLQQIIMLTSPFMLNPNAHVLLFVEEPELYLHPGFQRALIDAWTSYEGSLQVFVSTHSQEFLDITLDSNDISVFRCSKSLDRGTEAERDAVITVTPVSTGERPLLRELGIRNSSVMLSNCTVWVEGITDRMYLRKYLALYTEHLRASSGGSPPKPYLEDVHYSFVEYSGGNITHWSFLDKEEGVKGPNVDRLCGELCLVMDLDDPDSEAKNDRRARLKEVLGDDRFFPLESREIENLLPPKAVLAAIKSRIKKELRINEGIAWADYRKEPLGAFIRDVVLLKEASPKFADQSGTIYKKDRFATDAIASLEKWEDLTEEAQSLTMKIYTFIKSKNR